MLECQSRQGILVFRSFPNNINTDKFNPQSFPMTQSKMDSLSKRLDSVYKYLKEQYILKNKQIDISAVDLYNDYKFYTTKPVAKEDFHRKLNEIGINKTKHGTKIWYNIEHETLLNIGKTKNWINEIDEYNDETDMFSDTDSSSVISDTQALINFSKANKSKHSIAFDDI